MDKDRILRILEGQRTFFQQEKTWPLAQRLCALNRLDAAISAMETEMQLALQEDLGKATTESFLSEIAQIRSELHFFQRNLGRLAKARSVPSSLTQLPAEGRIVPCPRGRVLIISPWNYPFLLSLAPAIAALAAGNTVVIKPSECAPQSARMLHRLLSQALPRNLAAVIPGGAEETAFLLDQPFDHIFYTGGAQVGRLVMERAAAQLTPVTLELGGKSPCMVDETARISLAARRIVFGKLLNCGQTCVAPDYVLVQEAVKDKLLTAIGHEIRVQYGEYPLQNPDYGRIVNQRHFDRLCALIDPDKVVFGGQMRSQSLQIAPTLLDQVQPDDPVMQEEIFGPILPILIYRNMEEALALIASKPHPLAFYLFSENKETQHYLMQRLPFGGGCVNDTVLHTTSPYLPFGGFGESGMGSYHGKAGFDTFTHYKSVLYQNTYLDAPLRYQPYTPQKSRLLRHLLR